MSLDHAEQHVVRPLSCAAFPLEENAVRGTQCVPRVSERQLRIVSGKCGALRVVCAT